jgi:holliday junction DNA helicase RuvB
LYEVDQLGLDRLDREILNILVVRFGGKPVGLSTLAVSVGEEQDTIEAVVEPFLIRAGLIARTARGRQATAAGFGHLGQSAPTNELDGPVDL